MGVPSPWSGASSGQPARHLGECECVGHDAVCCADAPHRCCDGSGANRCSFCGAWARPPGDRRVGRPGRLPVAPTTPPIGDRYPARSQVAECSIASGQGRDPIQRGEQGPRRGDTSWVTCNDRSRPASAGRLDRPVAGGSARPLERRAPAARRSVIFPRSRTIVRGPSATPDLPAPRGWEIAPRRRPPGSSPQVRQGAARHAQSVPE